MAIDTRNKRASTVQFIRPWMLCPPAPDGSLANAADRQHTGHSYAGISTSATTSVMSARRRGAWHGAIMGPINLVIK